MYTACRNRTVGRLFSIDLAEADLGVEMVYRNSVLPVLLFTFTEGMLLRSRRMEIPPTVVRIYAVVE